MLKRSGTAGLWLALLMAPALAAPQVTSLGVDSSADADPVAACGALAASPFEPGHEATGLSDKQIFLDGALTACTAALAAAPDNVEVKAWLGRVDFLIGKSDEAQQLLGDAADSGSAFAAYTLATSRLTFDDERIGALLQQAADAGFAPALTALAARYETGTGVDADTGHAFDLYKQAAEAGDPAGMYKAGEFLQLGLTGDPDYAEAQKFFQQAIDKGEPRGWYGIGQLYQFGEGTDVDFKKAAEAYQHGADASEPMAETQLAYLFQQGQGVETDEAKSTELLTDAANQNYGLAQSNLAVSLLFGQGTKPDPQRAFNLAWAAVNQHVSSAYGVLGYMYAEGLGTDRDLDAALMHFQEGAQANDQYSTDRIPITQAEIACQDAAGSPQEPGGFSHGVEFDAMDAEAAITACEAALEANPGSVGDKVWVARAYIKAGRESDAVPLVQEGYGAGNPLAMTLAAELILEGKALARNDQQVLALYKLAADKSFAPAQLALGDIYAKGELVPQDSKQALDWYKKAADNGMDAANERIADLGPPETHQPSVDLTGFGRAGPGY